MATSFATLDEGSKSPGGAPSPSPAPSGAQRKAASHEEPGAAAASAAAGTGAAGAKHAPGPVGDGKSSIAGAVFNLANAVRAPRGARARLRAATHGGARLGRSQR
jgi:hypothetical protein